jgi:translation initiation factor 2B subunit (eIF-2B alpha/beta/delta family)
MTPKQKFNRICREIKLLKIQSATTLAKKAFYAYKLQPSKQIKKKLLSLRPTEPMLENILKNPENFSYTELINRLDENQTRINKFVYSLIKNNSVIFTHCHASTIVRALIYSKKKGRKFEVYNTETRPRFQGRKTSKELRNAGIKVTMFVDSAALIALTKNQDKEEKTKPVDLILLGADAITKKGVVNKVGSGMFAEIANLHKIPLYIVSDSLKFSNKKIKFEQRSPLEIWKYRKIRLVNPAFEFIPKKYIRGIISEYGILSYEIFLKEFSKLNS